jgi:hypothetical protein
MAEVKGRYKAWEDSAIKISWTDLSYEVTVKCNKEEAKTRGASDYKL